jgi:histidine decarboxylase
MSSDSVIVPADDCGEMDYDALALAAEARADRPAIIVATVGTTMTEAVDDVARIHAALDRAGVPSRHIHVDGALSGGSLDHVHCRPT